MEATRLPRYDVRWLAPDAVAGLTLAAYAIPVGLAYSALAGLPPQSGVYGFLLGGLGYALLGTSRKLSIGPTSAISLLVGTSVAPLAKGDAGRFVEIASLAAGMIALLAVVGWALRLSNLTHFISDSILVGFKAGAGLSIAVTQLPDALGIAAGGGTIFERLESVWRQLGHVNPVVVALSLGALALLVAGERWLPHRPVSLGVVAVAIAVTAALGLRESGVACVGALPAGLPGFAVPSHLSLAELNDVVPLASACLLLGYIESLSAARALAAPEEEIDARRELLALGGANLAAALGQSYPVAGGLSQSVVNDKAGARSSASLVAASLALALALVFLSDSLRDLPKAVLAAIVLYSVIGLVDVPTILQLRRASRAEFRVAMTAVVGVLLLGVLQGVALAAVASVLLLLHRLEYPHVAFLGRIPGTNRFSDLARHADNEELAAVLPVRVEGAILYLNADAVRRRIEERVRAKGPGLRQVIFDLSTSAYVDLAGARMLVRLARELAAQKLELHVANAHASVRDLLREEGLEAVVGHISRRDSVEDEVHAFLHRAGSATSD